MKNDGHRLIFDWNKGQDKLFISHNEDWCFKIICKNLWPDLFIELFALKKICAKKVILSNILYKK